MPMVTRLLRNDDACDTIGVLAKINANSYLNINLAKQKKTKNCKKKLNINIMKLKIAHTT